MPEQYRLFLPNAKKYTSVCYVYDRILQNGHIYDGLIFDFLDVESFLLHNQYREHLIEFQEHFEIPRTYVEAEHLYFIADGAGAICIALAGLHVGKIYSSDNGDFGIIYQAEDFNSFMKSIRLCSN